jgi:putative DNA methylase
MAVFSKHHQVLEPEGEPMTVGSALDLINQALDEVMTEQEGDFDSDTRWAVAWFEAYGLAAGPYGDAEKIAIAKNTSVEGLVEAGFLLSKAGKVRLKSLDELDPRWDPITDNRLTIWEIVQYLCARLEKEGEQGAALLVGKLGGKVEIARELAYRLYKACERTNRAKEALSYNALVQSWPEISRLAREGGKPQKAQSGLFGESEE